MKDKLITKKYEMSAKESIYSHINLQTPYLAIDLYDAVDEAALLCAVRQAIAFHPLFGTRLVIENGLYCYEENPLPPVIFRADNAPSIYGTAVNNYYPWMFVLRDKRMILYTMHYVTDVVGMVNFCKTVLHLYFEQKGVAFEDSKTDFPEGTPEQTLENAYKKYADPSGSGIGTPRFAAPAPIAPGLIRRGTVSSWRLLIPSQEIRKFAKESETSVFSVMSCIFSRAMVKAYGVQSGNISVRVPVNLRSAFPSITDRNFVQGYSLCYMADRMNAMSDAKVETSFRSQLDIWLEKGNLVQCLNEGVEIVNSIKADPKALDIITDYGKDPQPRANILYSHVTRTGLSEELQERIADMHLAENGVDEDYVSVFAVNVHSEMSMTVHQCSLDDCYIDALREVLDGREISYTLYPVELEPERSGVDTSALPGV